MSSIFKRLANIARTNFSEWLENSKTEQKEGKKSSKTYEPYQHKESESSSPYTKKELQYFYDLEMKPSSDLQSIKAQYRKLIKKYHPDNFYRDEERREIAHEISLKINEIWEYFEKRFDKDS